MTSPSPPSKLQHPAPTWERQMQFAVDSGVLLVSYILSYLIRFDFAVPSRFIPGALQQLPLVLLLQLIAAARSGLYSFMWRYIGLSELRSFLQAAFFVAAPLTLMRLMLPESMAMWRVPLSIIFLSQVFGFGGMLGVRVLRRLIWEAGGFLPRTEKRQQTLVVGAGRAGASVARELRRSSDSKLIGLLDDDPAKRNLSIHAAPVLGVIDDLAAIIERHSIGLVVVAIRQAPRELMRQLIETCKTRGVAVRVVPSLEEVLSGRAQHTFRSVEIEDLLGRKTVELDRQSMQAFLTDRTVLVTGAGGSIGSEICRQIAGFAPALLLLVERAEFALFEIHRELLNRFPDTATQPIVADVADTNRMRQVLFQHRPEVVIHAAAHKHVGLMEKNASEAIKNNVLATHAFGECCASADVQTFVQISTDKAVQPTSIMGASKRLAELVVQSLNVRHATRFVAVRFGNVMGSAGSVVPIFRRQIDDGGPVTVTHPDMTRFFMTIPEASQLVLQAGALSRGGEIMVLDMGEPVRILDLAEDMIRLSGFRPHQDIEIRFTGPGRGEKLSEELQSLNEDLQPTLHAKILNGRIRSPDIDLEHHLAVLSRAAAEGTEGEIRRALQQALASEGVQPGFLSQDDDDAARGLPS